MMRFSLVVLSGFFQAAQRAVQYADSLASALGGRLVLLHVKRASLFDPYVFVGETMRREELDYEKDTSALLAQLVGRLRAPTTVELTTDLLPEVAFDLASRHQPALFVLGLPATERASSELLSTAALDLLRSAQLPMLLVPVATAASALPQRVLIAADGDDFALKDCAAVSELFRALAPELTVVHVSPLDDDETCARALRAVQRSGLTAAVRSVDLRGYQHKSPTGGLLEAIGEQAADLVVVLARPHSYLGELFHRSVTARVIAQSPVPVLVLPVSEPSAPRRKPLHLSADDGMLWPEV
ncbi:universal stress protein [Hymenobacter jejuensis]|uniref:UspA domain-containing protein n=1 Tax=Hymenobacter jejuensis TaxID=2502781 RepID=A0A5B8A2Z5_9BACT|nr:universal stress protein [Hymenobacter jejuensis]QDA61035.1 hypothetical protein FHG12_13390 [Hymenobacter jejuensis]